LQVQQFLYKIGQSIFLQYEFLECYITIAYERANNNSTHYFTVVSILIYFILHKLCPRIDIECYLI
jgi:hypothetical protein